MHWCIWLQQTASHSLHCPQYAQEHTLYATLWATTPLYHCTKQKIQACTCSHIVIWWIKHDSVDFYICTHKSHRHEDRWQSILKRIWLGTALVSMELHGLCFFPTACIIPLSHNCKTDSGVTMTMVLHALQRFNTAVWDDTVIFTFRAYMITMA